jgi:hypothetical protein
LRCSRSPLSRSSSPSGPSDLPAAEPESPFLHLDDRKAAIYENLRDLQFEYRVGKLSDTGLSEHQEGPAKGAGRGAGRSRPLKAQLASKAGHACPRPQTKTESANCDQIVFSVLPAAQHSKRA